MIFPSLSLSNFRHAGDKIKRIVNYLLHQKTFYPLTPAGDNVNLDSTRLSRFARLERVPHLLILPSDQRPFIRVINK